MHYHIAKPEGEGFLLKGDIRMTTKLEEITQNIVFEKVDDSYEITVLNKINCMSCSLQVYPDNSLDQIVEICADIIGFVNFKREGIEIELDKKHGSLLIDSIFIDSEGNMNVVYQTGTVIKNYPVLGTFYEPVMNFYRGKPLTLKELDIGEGDTIVFKHEKTVVC